MAVKLHGPRTSHRTFRATLFLRDVRMRPVIDADEVSVDVTLDVRGMWGDDLACALRRHFSEVAASMTTKYNATTERLAPPAPTLMRWPVVEADWSNIDTLPRGLHFAVHRVWEQTRDGWQQRSYKLQGALWP